MTVEPHLFKDLVYLVGRYPKIRIDKVEEEEIKFVKEYKPYLVGWYVGYVFLPIEVEGDDDEYVFLQYYLFPKAVGSKDLIASIKLKNYGHGKMLHEQVLT